ncbi:MAG: hypothetical protein Q9219_001196 [cf. Caloplaca sp. 3 TL-2023]
MFYARAALNAKGKVRFGLRHIHVLNRYPNADDPNHTIHVMKYIFPRQFGLHNVFTSSVDPTKTAQPFLDYTLRESEIARKSAASARLQIPKRLRGAVFELVKKLQKLHSNCAYYELLKHYCPFQKRITSHRGPKVARLKPRPPSVHCAQKTQLALASTATQASIPPSQSDRDLTSFNDLDESPIIDFATPFSDVSAFCRAVLANIIPNDVWGSGLDGTYNKRAFMYNVDRFIRLRRFESLTLHAVIQGLKISSINWLIPPRISKYSGISSSDLKKRRELLYELLYYLGDSVLIPLVRSNFHVTESNRHKNRIFYFRHDIWRALTEPALAEIKNSMFEEVPFIKARQLLDARSLGFSQIRLLPKDTKLRPIMNLRRRVTQLQGGQAVLGRSINSIVGPVHKMLDLERKQKPGVVGSALFSIGDMYSRLKAFRDCLCSRTGVIPQLYFVKVDVQSCFDTIPQQGAVRIMERLASDDVYRIARHAQIKGPDSHRYGHGTIIQAKPARKFLVSAHPPLDFRSFDEIIEETLACEQKCTVYVDNVVRTTHKKQRLLEVLKEHVERNFVRIGKKFFRQKNGIPQGSVLSSLLCNCFYAELEAQHLSFLDDNETLLLRLIDDFLIVTTKKREASRFLQTMHDGIEEYGVRVNPAKSLANFDVTINGVNISKIRDSSFPYCGTTIDTRTLGISKDRNRGKAIALADSLTVEQSNIPGQIFHRKAMNALKIQSHKMFLDTSFNSTIEVMKNIYQNFFECAMKYYRYVKSMGRSQEPHKALLIGTIQDVIDMAFVLVKAKHRSQTPHEYVCAVSKRQVRW